MNWKSLILFAAVFGYFACSADITLDVQPEKNSKKFYHTLITPEFGEIHCWVNNMPNSKKLLHLSGEVTLKKSEVYKFESLQLSQVRIYQNDSLFYFAPLQVMENKITSDTTSRALLFNTYNGLDLKEGFIPSRSVLLDFIFKDGKSLYSAVVRDVYIEKVY